MGAMRYSCIASALACLVACSQGCAGSKGKGGASGAGASGSGSAGTSGSTSGSGAGADAGSGKNPTGQNDPCAKAGDKRACCGTAGSQTCQGTAKIPVWGPCMASSGLTLTTCSVASGDGGGPAVQSVPKACSDPSLSTEPEIIAAYQPSGSQTVGSKGQIKVWVTDECPTFLASGEVVDAKTGLITTPGDRTALAADNYLNEPALYIAPDSAEGGGTPHFPQYIRGAYNNMPPGATDLPNFVGCFSTTVGSKGPALETLPAGSAPLNQLYSTEIIWDVDKLGLSPGSYIAEFSIHDGDRERAFGCVNLAISGTN
ncbi:MAG TPA: hypothetical protein VF331_19055 [Polyangiales bacterium]